MPVGPANSDDSNASQGSDRESGQQSHTDDRDDTLETPSWSTRGVLLCGILAGLSGVLTMPVVSPEQYMLASDVYFYAAEALLDGGDIYEVTPPDRPGFHYIYPPVVVFTFVPHALTGSPLAAYLLQTVLNVGFATGITVLLWRGLSRRGVSLSRLDAVLLFGFVAISSYSAISMINGQVNIGLSLAVALGLDYLDRNRGDLAGVCFALAASVKVFPAVLGLWLLRSRAYRGVALAIAVGLSGLLAGTIALGPDLMATYLGDVLTGRYDGFDGAPDPTQTRGGTQRQVAALFGIGPPYVTPLAALSLAPVLGYLYLDIQTEPQRYATVLGTILVTLLFLPLQRLYMVLFVFPFVLLLYRLPPGRPRTVLILGALVSFVRLDFSLVEYTLTTAPLGTLESPALAVCERFFEVVLPPTLGMWVLLLACVLVHYHADQYRNNGVP